MNVTSENLWQAYKTARRHHDDMCCRAGRSVSLFAGTTGGLSQYALDVFALPARAADLEAEQLYREYEAVAS